MKDVYVTNHEPKKHKYFTLNEEEDKIYYNYIKSLEEYNNSLEIKRSRGEKRGRFE